MFSGVPFHKCLPCFFSCAPAVARNQQWNHSCLHEIEQTEPGKRRSRSRRSNHHVLEVPDLNFQLHNTEVQHATDLMPEIRLPGHSTDMSFMFEITSKEELKNSRREERGISTFISHAVEERRKILSHLSC